MRTEEETLMQVITMKSAASKYHFPLHRAVLTFSVALFMVITANAFSHGLSLSDLPEIEFGVQHQRVAFSQIPDRHSRIAGRKVEEVGIAWQSAIIKEAIEREFPRIRVRRFHRDFKIMAEECGCFRPHIGVSCPNKSQLFVEADITLVRGGIPLYGQRASWESRLSLITEEQGRELESRAVTRKSDMSVGISQAKLGTVV